MKIYSNEKARQVDKLIVQFEELKSNIICMTSKLNEIVESANHNGLIETVLFTQAIDSLQHHCELQNSFLQKLENATTDLKFETLEQAGQALHDLKKQISFYDGAIDSLRKFQQISIEHEGTRQLFAEYQKKALKILKISAPNELMKLCEPYVLFLELMECKVEDITIEQEKIIENEFQKPIPKMLYAKKFFISHLNADVSLTNTEINSVDDYVEEKLELKYSYKTKKEGKSFSVKSFRQEMQNSNGVFNILLLYTLGWYRILSREQFDKYLPTANDEKNNIDATLTLLLREGYLTEIVNSLTEESLYCLSARGLQIFLRKESWDEFKKADKNKPSLRGKPLLLTATRDIQGKDQLIDTLVVLNEISLFIYYVELPKYSFINNISVYNKETIEKKLPFAEFIIENCHFGIKKKILLLVENTENPSDYYELADTAKNADIVLLSTKNNLTYDSIRTLILSEKEFYYVKLDSIEKKLSLVGKDDQEYDFSAVVNSLNIQSADSLENSQDSKVMSAVKHNIDDSAIVEMQKIDIMDILQKPSGEVTLSDAMNLISKLLLEEKVVEAVVLAKTLSFIPKKEFLTLHNRLLYATNLSFDSHKNNSESLGALDDADVDITAQIQPALLKLLRLSAFAWALLIPDLPHDYQLYSYKDGVIADAYRDFNAIAPSLKKVFEILFELGTVSAVGFSNSVMFMFKVGKEQQLANSRLMGQAKELLKYNLPNMRSHLPGTPEMFESCFGQLSELCNCMKIIAEGDTNNRDYVKNVFAKFEETLSDTVAISFEKIDSCIDETWDNVEVKKIDMRKKPKKLIEQSTVRNAVVSGMKKRLEVVAQWLVITDALANNKLKGNQQLASIRNRLITQLDNVCGEISQVNPQIDSFLRAGLVILKYSLSKMKDYLQNGTPYHGKWDYFELLLSHYMSLDSEYKPALDKNLQSVAGFEPWRRMVGHILAEKRTPLEILSLIDNPREADWFKNYHSAECISLYLFENDDREMTDYSSAIAQAKADAKNELEMLHSELELAYAYGRIEESTKEDILKASADFSDYLINIQNFGHYREFLSVLRTHIHDHSEAREKELITKVERIKETFTEIDPSILDAVNRNLAENNLTVAEEYINRLEQGDVSLSDELKTEAASDIESEYHDKFIKDYNFFFQLCKDNLAENVLARWGQRGIMPKIRNFTQGQIKSSFTLLESWPKGKDSRTLTDDVMNLLSNFGFTVIDKKLKTYKKCELFDVRVAAKAKNLDDYSHPIARFGTQISEPISVICLFGRTFSSPAALKEILIDDSLKLANSTFVLVDATFSLNERRMVAELLKSEIHSMNSFIVIDRTLILFLATLDSAKWLQALMKCTLPYTYCQPYVQGVGVVSDEMFFGRKAELHNIRDYNGACLVYGGRQLGKTALLKRACSLMNNPALKKYGFYKDIKNCNAEKTLLEVCKELMKANIIHSHYSSIESLCAAISAKLDKKEVSEMQLYLDEADAFFEDISFDNYEALKPFKELRDNYPNRFKVVFAGLHRVAHNKSNSVIVHLGKPLCIKPFSTTDAKNLVERPLAHLGFQFQGNEGKKQLSLILASTNYYPGLLHLFCYKLVESISENYKSYYSALKDNPPFVISEEHLRRVMFASKLNEGIKEFFTSTLALDFRYKLIANIIAYLCYRDFDNDLTRPEGFHIYEIKNCEEIPLCVDMKTDDFKILLEELEEMGILWRRPGTDYYRLRKNSFLEMIGSKDEIELSIIAASCGEYEDDERTF